MRVLAVPRPALRADPGRDNKRRFWTPSRRAASPTATSRVAPTCFPGVATLPHRGARAHHPHPRGRRRQRTRALDAGEPERGRVVLQFMPTYQQLYSIPEMCGAAVDVLHLEKENGYHVDVEALDALCTPETKVICINNPDNPTGALLDGETLRAIVEVARKNDAWLHCDEVYRHLNQADEQQAGVGRRPLRQGRRHQFHEQGVVAGGHPSGLVRRGRGPAAPRPSVPSRLQPHLLRLVRRGRGRLRAGPCRRQSSTAAAASCARIWLRFWNGWNRSRTCPSVPPRPARRRSSTTTTTSPPTISAPIW